MTGQQQSMKERKRSVNLEVENDFVFLIIGMHFKVGVRFRCCLMNSLFLTHPWGTPQIVQ